jgi:hypothetical protein
MKRLLHFLFFIILVRSGYGQPTRYGNEWVDYTKTYCKVYVTTDGIYRIPYSLLNTNIPNLAAANPNNLVMVHNGQPIPITVHTNAGGAIDSTTYVEFFGKKNIGDVDSVLFFQPGYQPYTWYSYFSDTSVYFLTVSSQSNNPRYTYVADDTLSIPSLTQDMYFWFSSHVIYTAATGGTFYAGRDFDAGGSYLYKSIFDRNEGWGKEWFYYGSNPISMSLPVSSIYTSGPSAIVNADVFTRTWEPHNLVFTLDGNTIQTLTFDNSNGGFDMNLISVPVAPSALGTSNTMTVSETAYSTSTAENAMVYSEILYPRMFAFDGDPSFEFVLQPGSSGERYFQVSNFNDGGTYPLLYDVTNGYVIRAVDAPGVATKRYVIPAAAGPRELFIRDDNASTYTTIARMDTVTFQNYTILDAQGNYMVIANKALYKDSMGHNWVSDYVNYRSRTTTPGAGHLDARLFDYDQIIDQFGYGVKQTPLAIRNFVEYAYDHWTKKPEYLFLMGKGVMYYQTRGASLDYNQNLVPTFGQPASDNLFACRRGSNRPLIATGRLAARSGTDVENYLNKVIVYERLQNAYGDPHQNKNEKLYMKKILHLSGGSDADEQVEFAANLANYSSFATDTSWGANVFTVYKTVSDPVDNSQVNLINQHIDSGVSLMTVFGHAAASTFDINVDQPEQWTNYDKYPMIYSNGCAVGAISSYSTPQTESLSERFVLLPNKGSIGFTATSDLSVASSLDNYAVYMYSNFCQNYYNKPWGKSLQHTQIDMDSLYSTDDFTMLATYEMTLHGDPAITVNQYNLPDYQIDQSSVFFNPSTVTANLDSFAVNVICTNLGRAIKDSMLVTVTRTYTNPANPSGTLSTAYTWKVRCTYYQDTFVFKIPTFPAQNQGYGQNEFTVFVESGQRIPELSETNNGQSVQFSLYIESNDILPIYPYQFAIVPKQNITVKASTADPFAKLQSYRLQVDTTGLFIHPLAQTTVRQVGGVIHWKLPITFKDSTVYYWRVSRDSISDTTGFRWHASSFVYIKNEYPGWNQSHYYQYQQDNYPDNVYLDKDRIFKFKPTVNKITVTTGVSSAVGGPGNFTANQLNWTLTDATNYQAIEYDYRMGSCGYANPATNGGFTFAVIDTVTGYVWQSINNSSSCNFGQFGNWHCNLAQYGQAAIQNGFDFSAVGTHPADACNPTYTGLLWGQVISRFLDSIPNGCIIVMYAVDKVPYTTLWQQDSSLVNKLAAMGATGLWNLCRDTGAAMHPAAPYIFFTVKGSPARSQQSIGTNFAAALTADIPLTATYTYTTLINHGTYVTPTIGPAETWGSFHWRWRPGPKPAADRQHVDIIGIQANGTQTPLFSTSALDTSLNFINARLYPNIYMRMNVENDTSHVPSQLYYWRVLYKTEPEAAINPAAYFYVQRDTVGLGDSLNIGIALENVTDISMDSMRTQYTIRNLQNGYQQSAVIKQDSLRANDTIILRYKQLITNTALNGNDQITIEANPLDALHQPEEYHFNNYAVINFGATGDNVNPLLDVTFDSRRIMNGDIVSAKPDIVITVRDENKYLALIDTNVAQVYVRYPGQVSPTLINYDNNILTFFPATGNLAKLNQARIEFKPTFLLDGSYDLLVRDKDASGNYSSNSTNRYEGTTYNGIYYDYKITFNIITKSMISNVLTYPNPFSTRTQFVFTLTGSQVPDYMKIQIMTITGKVVKEITKDQLGNIHVGVNLTDYYWDGHDQYGNKLANGVYFYRVITDIANKQLDNFSSTQNGEYFNNTNIDKYFKNGFGKLVIMR